jgi:Flp pilus assembly protein TadG
MRQQSVQTRFFRDRRGASAVEFALLAPVLITLLLGAVTVFDLFRTLQNVEKATFTVGDMMSREFDMNSSKLSSMLTLMREMVSSANDGGLRVSSITRRNGNLVTDWSRSTGQAVPTTPVSTVNLPRIAEGDSVLLTETFVPHNAFVASFGLDAVTFRGKVAHRPRFVTSMAFR